MSQIQAAIRASGSWLRRKGEAGLMRSTGIPLELLATGQKNEISVHVGLWSCLWTQVHVVHALRKRALNSFQVIHMHILSAVLLGCVASRPVIGWRLCPSNSAQTTDRRGVGHIWQLLCFTCMQAITVDNVISYITDDDRPNISSASSRRGAKRRGGLWKS